MNQCGTFTQPSQSFRRTLDVANESFNLALVQRQFDSSQKGGLSVLTLVGFQNPCQTARLDYEMCKRSNYTFSISQ